jgi:ribosomal-protein-alanine N-acetyltransferase
MIKLETERLLFRDHEPGDLEAYCAIESDPLYRFPQRVHPRAEHERSFREGWLVPKPMGLLATVFKPDHRYIGRCGLYPFRDDADEIIPGEAQIAFDLAREYWGRGLATEAGRAFVDYGFDELGLRRIQAGINTDNKASIRVIEKLGFQWWRSGKGDGTIRWHEFELFNPNPQPVGSVV